MQIALETAWRNVSRLYWRIADCSYLGSHLQVKKESTHRFENEATISWNCPAFSLSGYVFPPSSTNHLNFLPPTLCRLIFRNGVEFYLSLFLKKQKKRLLSEATKAPPLNTFRHENDSPQFSKRTRVFNFTNHTNLYEKNGRLDEDKIQY